MRLRNKPWAKPLIAKHPAIIVTDPAIYRGKWQSRFAKEAPLYLEIGMGKGKFIIEMARKHPENNYLGMELQTTVAAVALKKLLQIDEMPTNLQLVCGNGNQLLDFFAGSEINGIFLNFSDPWLKKKQAKRRLTYQTFLSQYQQVMVTNGKIEFKTDNQGFFEFSVKSLNNFGMKFDEIWLDLHHSEASETNVMTEYEEKFSQKGQPIFKLIAHFD
ncbi:tRNA (guanosine(46)-N7)-methyltransferase TrmB [Liquorilactobacillus sicerae]|uniref:tRNA (guanosine(46)-N7)-methyltransferase TrmB n=1 Tax=Liquorilactobacillus sicerae TaxID=1416943 RepID=UPI002480151B|nr:tRNA (guanosine(46)-N7)-methyltransferase TrmB [Liquorilactobacillus sicerae]